MLIETKGRLQFASISILWVTTDQINAKRAFAIILYKRVRIPETAKVKINGFIANRKGHDCSFLYLCSWKMAETMFQKINPDCCRVKLRTLLSPGDPMNVRINPRGILRRVLHLRNKNRFSFFLSIRRNTAGNLGEREILEEHEPQANVSTIFSSPQRSQTSICISTTL